MFLSAYLALWVGQLPIDVHAGENPLQQLTLDRTAVGVGLSWKDEDEALQGTAAPLKARVGQPLTVNVAVRPLAGPAFEGPIVISLRPLEEMGSTQTQTVTPAPGGKGWTAVFSPQAAGEYRLELRWRSTHHKVVRGTLSVEPAGLPPWFNWVIGVGLVLLAVAGGAWALLRSKEPAAP